MRSTDSKIEEAEQNQKEVMAKFVEICDMLMIKKSEEIRSKSEKFMEFFTAFFNDVQKAMPKIEEPKKEKKVSTAKKAGKSVMQMNMMAELKAKQA